MILDIALHDELRRIGQVKENPAIEDIRTGDLVSAQLGPAIAPLRRVLDQAIRLFDVMVPMIPGEEPEADTAGQLATRQQRRQQAREAATRGATDTSASGQSGSEHLRVLRRLFVALRDDLEHSGMIDIVVTREDSPSVLLTLDRRFVFPPALELLHTAEFTVVGKVTQVWRKDGTVVNPYRRSALSLVPSLAQSVAWGVLALLGGLARSIDATEMQRVAEATLGHADVLPLGGNEAEASGDASGEPPQPHGKSAEIRSGDEQAEAEDAEGDIRVGDDVAALYSMVAAPAYQVLPLALCS